MKVTRYTAEFKAEAIKQITERGHSVVETSKRLGISDKSLYAWLKQSRDDELPISKDIVALKQELNRMKVELKRTTEERDILKKAAAYFHSEQCALAHILCGEDPSGLAKLSD